MRKGEGNFSKQQQHVFVHTQYTNNYCNNHFGTSLGQMIWTVQHIFRLHKRLFTVSTISFYENWNKMGYNKHTHSYMYTINKVKKSHQFEKKTTN